MNVVISGAGRGIGLGFVKHYLQQGADVWGCYRSDDKALQAIGSNRLRSVRWDVREDHDETFAERAAFPAHIDLLINNAGVYGPKDDNGQSLEHVTPAAMLELFDVNCVGPLRVVQCLLSRIIAAQGKIANVSSKMGSSEDNSSGGCYAYRASKAGLVMISKSMAIDLLPYGVRVITLHPGWVRTDMTEHQGLIDIETSVAGMTQVIERVDAYSPGAFVAYDGAPIPY